MSPSRCPRRLVAAVVACTALVGTGCSTTLQGNAVSVFDDPFSVAGMPATDGPTGLKIAAQMQPDLILLDINLPEMDGYDLARRFRDTPGLQDVPILAVTANVMQGDRERTLAAGCDGYIQKPIDVDRLPQQVKAALRKTHT